MGHSKKVQTNPPICPMEDRSVEKFFLPLLPSVDGDRLHLEAMTFLGAPWRGKETQLQKYISPKKFRIWSYTYNLPVKARDVCPDLNYTSKNAMYYDLGVNLTQFSSLVFQVKGNNSASLCLTPTRINAAASCPGYQLTVIDLPSPLSPPNYNIGFWWEFVFLLFLQIYYTIVPFGCLHNIDLFMGYNI